VVNEGPDEGFFLEGPMLMKEYRILFFLLLEVSRGEGDMRNTGGSIRAWNTSAESWGMRGFRFDA
jgi:hypothetical protein